MNKTTIMKRFSHMLQLKMAKLGMNVASADEDFIHMLCGMYVTYNVYNKASFPFRLPHVAIFPEQQQGACKDSKFFLEFLGSWLMHIHT